MSSIIMTCIQINVWFIYRLPSTTHYHHLTLTVTGLLQQCVLKRLLLTRENITDILSMWKWVRGSQGLGLNPATPPSTWPAMEKQKVLRFEGCNFFRQRLVLSTLTSLPVKITKIRQDSQEPGIRGKLGGGEVVTDTVKLALESYTSIGSIWKKDSFVCEKLIGYLALIP